MSYILVMYIILPRVLPPFFNGTTANSWTSDYISCGQINDFMTALEQICHPQVDTIKGTRDIFGFWFMVCTSLYVVAKIMHKLLLKIYLSFSQDFGWAKMVWESFLAGK